MRPWHGLALRALCGCVRDKTAKTHHSPPTLDSPPRCAHKRQISKDHQFRPSAVQAQMYVQCISILIFDISNRKGAMCFAKSPLQISAMRSVLLSAPLFYIVFIVISIATPAIITRVQHVAGTSILCVRFVNVQYCTSTVFR